MSATFGGDDGRKDPETLEREIEDTRADVGDTLDALQARLSPGQLLDQGMRYMRGTGGEFFGNLGSTMRDNPMPVILTGIGIAWMMIASRNPPVPRYGTMHAHPSDTYAEDLDASGEPRIGERLREKAGEIGERVSDTAASVRDRMSSAAASVSGAADSARSAASSATERARIAAQRARGQAQRTSDQMSRLMHEQPLVIGAMGVALGAMIGALVPATDAENQLMGDTRDRLVDTAKAAAAGAKQAIDESMPESRAADDRNASSTR